MEWAIWDAIYIALIPAAIISIVTMVVVSLATQKRDPAKPILDAQGKPVDSDMQVISA
jgi:solute:Na+ symporter, SSS family